MLNVACPLRLKVKQSPHAAQGNEAYQLAVSLEYHPYMHIDSRGCMLACVYDDLDALNSLRYNEVNVGIGRNVIGRT